MIKIILDTNVFVSGIFWSGPPAKCKIIISGDKDLLEIDNYAGIEILKPSRFVHQYL